MSNFNMMRKLFLDTLRLKKEVKMLKKENKTLRWEVEKLKIDMTVIHILSNLGHVAKLNFLERLTVDVMMNYHMGFNKKETQN